MNNESVGKKIVEALKKQAENIEMEDSIDSSLFEDVVEEKELKQKLIESLELLTEKERRVIELYYYEDLTLKVFLIECHSY